ncbi:hypothetical protein [Spiroplasma sp. SV19]|uniref:hypothetical protein n=1 Tax=Spiroplasma sp. SV19 TaxID=2570468 RepID=UPI0024B6A954|nr:hypothetical protein [Spiroplasma sp. SV19]WHQ37364.1 hypothetical protein E7Y35_05805 [Spiroplasma sp. SV19]
MKNDRIATEKDFLVNFYNYFKHKICNFKNCKRQSIKLKIPLSFFETLKNSKYYENRFLSEFELDYVFNDLYELVKKSTDRFILIYFYLCEDHEINIFKNLYFQHKLSEKMQLDFHDKRINELFIKKYIHYYVYLNMKTIRFLIHFYQNMRVIIILQMQN